MAIGASPESDAWDLIPERPTLHTLNEAAAGCRACRLWRNATQTVFGEGTQAADVMLVGEQPGDREDLSGRPFVGPAGKLLDRALEEAGIDRLKVYVTNVVKHFKWVPRGKRRVHSKPNGREVAACAVTGYGDLSAVQAKFAAMLGHPLGCRITFFQRHGIARFRRPAVLHKHHGRARACLHVSQTYRDAPCHRSRDER